VRHVGREWALARLVPEESRRCGDKEYRIRRWWNAESSRIEKEIEVRREGSLETFRESVRAYTAGELAELLAGRRPLRRGSVGRLRRRARRPGLAAA
jgi:hypothetical protein